MSIDYITRHVNSLCYKIAANACKYEALTPIVIAAQMTFSTGEPNAQRFLLNASAASQTWYVLTRGFKKPQMYHHEKRG